MKRRWETWVFKITTRRCNFNERISGLFQKNVNSTSSTCLILDKHLWKHNNFMFGQISVWTVWITGTAADFDYISGRWWRIWDLRVLRSVYLQNSTAKFLWPGLPYPDIKSTPLLLYTILCNYISYWKVWHFYTSFRLGM